MVGSNRDIEESIFFAQSRDSDFSAVEVETMTRAASENASDGEEESIKEIPETQVLTKEEPATQEEEQLQPPPQRPVSRTVRLHSSRPRTPEPRRERSQQNGERNGERNGDRNGVEAVLESIEAEVPDTPESFDWDDFERRFEQALKDADENEKQILEEVESLSASFKAWASAASTRDDERASKRLQTRRRFVNMAEDRMEQKQTHYTQVVRAFENALALLKS